MHLQAHTYSPRDGVKTWQLIPLMLENTQSTATGLETKHYAFLGWSFMISECVITH